MKSFKNNYLVIDLRKFKTLEDIDKVLEDNNLSDFVSADKLMKLKSEGFEKIVLDKTTHVVIASTNKDNLDSKQIIFQIDFLDYLRSLNSIDFVPEDKIEVGKIEDMKLDDVLDKINE